MFQALVNSRYLIVQIAKYPSMLVLKPTIFYYFRQCFTVE